MPIYQTVPLIYDKVQARNKNEIIMMRMMMTTSKTIIKSIFIAPSYHVILLPVMFMSISPRVMKRPLMSLNLVEALEEGYLYNTSC